MALARIGRKAISAACVVARWATSIMWAAPISCGMPKRHHGVKMRGALITVHKSAALPNWRCAGTVSGLRWVLSAACGKGAIRGLTVNGDGIIARLRVIRIWKGKSYDVNVHVSCIRKRQHHNPHERIEGLGGVYKGERWYLTEDDIIAELEKPSATRRWDFYTKVNGHVAWLLLMSAEGASISRPWQTDTKKTICSI